MFKLISSFFLFTLLFVVPVSLQQVYAQQCENDYPQTTQNDRFEVHKDGTVTDKKTGLVWQQCQQGLSGELCDKGSAQRYTWEEALLVAEQSNGWRLPNIKELHSIVERQCVNPAINLTIFPNSAGAIVWSSSPPPHTNWWAWTVYFHSEGRVNTEDRDDHHHIRLVHSGE